MPGDVISFEPVELEVGFEAAMSALLRAARRDGYRLDGMSATFPDGSRRQLAVRDGRWMELKAGEAEG